MRGWLTMLFVVLASVAAVAQPAVSARSGASVAYQLPTDGPLPRTYRVTLAIVDAENPAWIISQFLRGEPRTVTVQNGGKFSDTWDGLDENFMPVPPGTYGVKGICMPAQKWEGDGEYHTLAAKLNGGPFAWLPARGQEMLPPQILGDPVGSPPGDVATADGKARLGVMYWSYLENGFNDFFFDLEKPVGLNQVIRGYNSGGTAGGLWTATDGEVIWSCASQWEAPSFIYRADRAKFGSDKALWTRDIFLSAGEVAGLAAWKDPASGKSLVYMAERGKWAQDEEQKKKGREVFRESPTDQLNRVRVLDGHTAAVVGEMKLPGEPVALATRAGKLYGLVHGPKAYTVYAWTLRNGLPAGDAVMSVTLQGVPAPSDLDVDSRRRVYVADPKANHVYRMGDKGQVEVTMGSKDGQKPGHYDPGTFMKPSRVAAWTDAAGSDRVLVVEYDGLGRVTEWSSEGKMLREWQGLIPGANDGWAADPEKPSDVYVRGHGDHMLRFKVDYATGKWLCDAVWPGIVGGVNNGWSQVGIGFPSIMHTNGHKYLTFGRGYTVYRFDGDKLLASAAIVRKGSGQNAKEYLWRDRNGDGVMQEEEIENTPLARPPGIYGYWGETWQKDLSLVAVGEGSATMWRLAPEGFDEHGNPIFKAWQKLLTDPMLEAKAKGIADALHGGNEISTVFDCAWRSVVGTPAEGWITDIRCGQLSANHGSEQKISRYMPDGHGGYRLTWRVGRSANIQAERGAIAGSIWASQPEYGLLPIIDQTRAGVHVFTLDEGLYVDTLMCDGSKQYQTIYGSPSEFFAGRVYRNSDDGKIYLAWGKHTPELFEVTGWTRDAGIRHIEKLPPTVALRADQIGDPPEMALQVRGGAGKAKVAVFLPAAGGAPALDGSLAGWEACKPVVYGEGASKVEVRCAYDPGNIYLRWQVRNDTAIQIKPLDPADRLFTHDRGADTVGFYLQCDPKAAGTAAAGRPGDVRLVFGLFDSQGSVKPAVLGMYPKYAGKGNATLYGSPVGKTSFEHVGLVEQAQLGYLLDQDKKGFVIAAAIPWKALPAGSAALVPGFRTMVNFDANFGGGKKIWWALGDGSASRETSDEPTEARLYPGSWAPASMQELKGGLVLRQWQAIGPFGFKELPGLDHLQGRPKICATLSQAKYPPETKVDLAAAYQGDETQTRAKQRTLKWQPVVTTDDAVKFAAVQGLDWSGYEDEGAAYLATWVYAPAATNVRLDVISGDGHHAIRGWINGTALRSAKGPAPTELRMEIDARQPVALNAGWNQVLLRFDQIWGDCHLGLKLMAPPEVLWGLKIRNAR